MKKRPLRPGTQVRLWAARDARASLLEGTGVLGELTGGCEGLTAPSEGLTVCQVPVVAPDKPRPSDSPTTLGEAHPRARCAAATDTRWRLARSCTFSALGRASLALVCALDPDAAALRRRAQTHLRCPKIATPSQGLIPVCPREPRARLGEGRRAGGVLSASGGPLLGGPRGLGDPSSCP